MAGRVADTFIWRGRRRHSDRPLPTGQTKRRDRVTGPADRRKHLSVPVAAYEQITRLAAAEGISRRQIVERVVLRALIPDTLRAIARSARHERT